MLALHEVPPPIPRCDDRIDVVTLAPSKFILRNLLRAAAERLGLTDRAIDALVTRSQVIYGRAGQRIVSPDDGAEFLHVLVSGAVRIVCRGARVEPMTVRIVRAGWVLNPAPLTRGVASSFDAEAHVSSAVAVLSRRALEGLLVELPSHRLLRLVVESWTQLAGLVLEKCQLLTMSLRERVLRELEILAGDFGRPHPDGVLIDLPVAHSDLAGLVVATRANVCRAMVSLRRDGRIAYVDRRIVLLESGKAAARKRNDEHTAGRPPSRGFTTSTPHRVPLVTSETSPLCLSALPGEPDRALRG